MMHLKLERDLCFFDLESTGLNIMTDRIVQIAIIKYFADGREPQELEMLINPGIPISEEAMAVHGIKPADLRNKPTFQQVAQKLYDFIGDADLAGYNSNRFDVPMLAEEFARVGIDFDLEKRRLLDVQTIFHKLEPRTLRAALRFYCGEDLEDAHDALADVRATVKVLDGQLERYVDGTYIDADGEEKPVPFGRDVRSIHEFIRDQQSVDVTRKLRRNGSGEIVFNFGKFVGQPVGKTLYENRQYFNWIQEKEFSAQVKKLTRRLLEEYKKTIRKDQT